MWVILLILITRTCTVTPEGSSGGGLTRTLQDAIAIAEAGDTLLLRRGIYSATPKPYREPICGNCTEPRTEVEATVGFHIEGKPLAIIGEDRDSTLLVTNAGYGILFEWSPGSYVSNLTVTGGVRDPDGNATDAALVAKQSRVTIQNVRIANNTHRIDTVVVGIGGIFGREGAELFIFGNTIMDNGWDGVALYRGATAVIAENVIQTGRGAGIGITWDAAAFVYRNRVSGYWKGIGAFGSSRSVVRNNAVFDNSGWGIIATGNAYMEVANNVIYHNGNCGFAVWEKTATGILKNNIIACNGWKEEWVCPGVGVWMNGSLDNFPVVYNDVWENRAGDYAGVEDQTQKNGNISQDPLFEETQWFILGPDSPCMDAGDPGVLDRNGTHSDMGLYGGPLSDERD